MFVVHVVIPIITFIRKYDYFLNRTKKKLEKPTHTKNTHIQQQESKILKLRTRSYVLPSTNDFVVRLSNGVSISIHVAFVVLIIIVNILIKYNNTTDNVVVGAFLIVMINK